MEDSAARGHGRATRRKSLGPEVASRSTAQKLPTELFMNEWLGSQTDLGAATQHTHELRQATDLFSATASSSVIQRR